MISAVNLRGVPVLLPPHTVIGVTANDVLNIRADIDSAQDLDRSKIIGTIPLNAVDVFVKGICQGEWRDVARD